MEKYIYLGVFIVFIPIMFKILQATRLEEAFKQGSIVQIRLAYFLGSIILAELATMAVERIFCLI